MPPWSADPAIGTFSNDPSLSADEITTITQWVAAGAPRGDSPAPPAPRTPTTGGSASRISCCRSQSRSRFLRRGVVDYQYIEIPTGLKEDRWIQAAEIRPTNRKAVHHALAFVKSPGLATPAPAPRGDGTAATRTSAATSNSTMPAWARSWPPPRWARNPEIYPPGTAKLLRAGSVITLQVHYTPYGEETTDQIGVGFVFADAPPKMQLKMVPFSKQGFTIPPRAANQVVEMNPGVQEGRGHLEHRAARAPAQPQLGLSS